MSRNLSGLNDILFEELERLNSDEIFNKKDTFEKELKRSSAITQTACQVIQNAKIVLEANKQASYFGKQPNNYYKLEDQPKIDTTNKLDNKQSKEKELSRDEKREVFKSQFQDFLDIYNEE